MNWNLPYRYAQRSKPGSVRDYIYFSAWNPAKEDLERRRIYIDHIKDPKTRDRHAKKLIEHINSQLEAGKNPFIEQENTKKYTTIEEALKFVLDFKGMYIRKRTKHTFDSRMGVLQDWLKSKKLLKKYIFEFDNDLAISFMNSLVMERKIKGRTYNNYLIDYRTFFNTLIKNNYITKNPFHNIDRMPEEETNKRPWTSEEIAIYFHYLENNDYDFYIISLYCYYLALRPTEICRLHKYDFQIDREIVIVPASSAKVRKKRIIPIAHRFRDLLVDYFAKIESGARICSTGMKPGTKEIAGTRIAEHFRRIANHLGFPKDLFFYALKDTAADRLLEAGFTPKTVRDLFGHSSIAITDKYLKKIRNTIDRKLIENFPGPI